jgi:dTDP-4-dehydrorhamnose 3,5-epimerase
MEPMKIDGAWVFEPKLFPDDRGTFHEWFQAPTFAGAAGHRFDVAQANCSISARGTVRGIHFADVPPGQAKYVTCVRGSILDVVVDIRVGSPTFGQWDSVELDDQAFRAVYVSEGLGHVFMALTDHATLVYLCSAGYAPAREHGVHPLDPDIGIAWPTGIAPLLSPKDLVAPTLAEALSAGILPSYDESVAFRRSLADGH